MHIEPVTALPSQAGIQPKTRWHATEESSDRPFDELALQVLERRRSDVEAGGRQRLVARSLLTGDVLAIAAAVVVTQAIVPLVGGGIDSVWPGAGLVYVVALSTWLLLTRIHGLRLRDMKHTAHSTVDEIGTILLLGTAVAWMVFVAASLFGVRGVGGLELVTFWCVLIPALVVFRSVARALARRRPEYLQNTVIIGTGSAARRMARLLLRHPDYGVNLLGFVAAGVDISGRLDAALVCPTPEDLLGNARVMGVERAIVAAPYSHHRSLKALVRDLNRAGITVDMALEVSDVLGPETLVHSVEGLPLLSLPASSETRGLIWLKRCLDVVLAGVVMLVFAPVFAVTAIVVLLDSPGPVIYRHRRVGMDGRPIVVLKFRTMYRQYCTGARYGGDTAEEELRRLMEDPARAREFEGSQKFSDDPRVTRIGRFLRKTSLDELPQLLNVLVGDLSLVGPRPITTEELTRYGRDAEVLLSVRPGVTGYWQINGRSSLDYDERIRLDLAYVSGRSLRLDLEILAKTVRVVLARGGAA